jgi:hypothetical protein
MLSSLRTQIEEVIASHENLAEARELLLVKRGKARTRANKVQLKRVDTGNAETEFMDRLREFMFPMDQAIPLLVSDAYTKLVKTRNDLAVTEDDYLLAERELTGLEWSYMDEDNDFYHIELKELVSSLAHQQTNTWNPDERTALLPPLPTGWGASPSTTSALMLPQSSTDQLFMNQQNVFPAVSKSAVSLDFSGQLDDHRLPSISRRHDDNVRQDLLGLAGNFEGFDEQHSDHAGLQAELETVTNHFPTTDKRTELISTFQRSKLPEKNQKPGGKECVDSLDTSNCTRRNSAPAPGARTNQVSFDSISVARTETALSTLSEDPLAEKRISEWLVEWSEINAVERAMRQDMLGRSGTSQPINNAWKHLVERNYRLPKVDNTDSDEASASEECLTETNSHRLTLEAAQNHCLAEKDGRKRPGSPGIGVQENGEGPVPLPLTISPYEAVTILHKDKRVSRLHFLEPNDVRINSEASFVNRTHNEVDTKPTYLPLSRSASEQTRTGNWDKIYRFFTRRG